MATTAAFETKSQRLARLLEISRVLTSTLELSPLLQSIAELAADLTQSAVASILLKDPGSPNLLFEAAPAEHLSRLRKLKVPLDGSVAGWVYTHRHPLVIHDAAEDQRIYRKIDQAIGFETRSMLAVPLTIKDRTIGVLEAINRLEHGHYTEDDLEILQTLAAQAAMSIESARLLEQLQAANEDLQRLDRMKSDFIAIASHELRTPLGLILGHATFLNEILPLEHREQMEVIVRSSLRLKEIVEDMASISHEERGLARVRPQNFSLAKMISEVCQSFQTEAAEKQIELGIDVPPEAPLLIEGDAEKIKVVLVNLLRNALTFTDPGGRVGVKAEQDDQAVKIVVVDTGIGIPPHDLEKIFERFYQVESHLTRRHGGMGLGLSIARAMVSMHGGSIACESKEGVGSLFWVSLPLKTSPRG